MSYRELSIQDLLRSCLEIGSEEAWAEWVRRIQPLVAGVVVKSVRRCGMNDIVVLDDLIQEVFLKLCKDEKRSLRAFQVRDDSSLFAYIKVLSANVAYDHCKYLSAHKRRRDAEESLDSDRFPAVSLGHNKEYSIESDVERILKQAQVCARDRAIFWLYFRDGFSAKEISQWENIGLTTKGVESCLSRLVVLLRNHLAKPSPATSHEGG